MARVIRSVTCISGGAPGGGGCRYNVGEKGVGMARKMLGESAISTFCGSMATMISAGIQVDEATLMLAENREKSHFQGVCNELYRHVSAGATLAEAMKATQAFPAYAIDMVSAGERSGHLEQVLQNLELYYDEEDRLFEKLRSCVGYPPALLCIMSIILAFTVIVILPIFMDVYNNMAGSLANGSFSSVGLSSIIGWIALIVMVVLAIAAVVLAAIASTVGGRRVVMGLLSRIPQTRQALYQLELSRFTASLATLVSSGIEEDESMARAMKVVTQKRLHGRLNRALNSMRDVDNPLSLTQAISQYSVFDTLYARMLAVGMRSGSADETLMKLSTTFFDDAVMQIDRAFDNIEPLLAALLTIAVGATLVAVMLPLIGIMTSIG